MSRYHSYLNTSTGIIRRYDGAVPLAVFLRSFFAANKKFGSRDRKQISHLCYCYYRTGKIFYTPVLPDDTVIQNHILSGLFLCSSQPNDLLQQIKPEWNEKIFLSPGEKAAIIQQDLNRVDVLSPLSVFPWKSALSEGIDHGGFCRSFFAQPDLFIRVRPDHKAIVQQKLDTAHIPYRPLDEQGMALPNNTTLDTIIEIDKEAVIQDFSSQQVATFLKPLQGDKKLKVWDCCAASGGKSILAADVLKNIDLTVSDIRKSILVNLEKRFTVAGIKEYTAKVMDLTISHSLPAIHHSPSALNPSLFDLVICDAPCSGSGTWARTPEQLYFWKENDISHYSNLQKKILGNIIPFIKPGGHLLYITCSVFRKENEETVNDIEKELGLQLLKMEVLKGYDKKADTLFAALMIRP
ncbi:MAG: Fmu (Sun) domain-containing protein [Chitinophagaceae bacterium]|nr:Fmu (Sun) domain-containing protein [Chitinophagaceae bacterium]